MTNFASNMTISNIINCGPENFESLALEIFHYQFNNNDIYRNYCLALRKEPNDIKSIDDIPFLPIQFFKSKLIKTGYFDAEAIFESSGTTGSINSKHHVKDVSLYETVFSNVFEQFYGDIKNYCVLGLLPSYLERGNSSLVFMVNRLIQQSEHVNSGFYLKDFDRLHQTLLNNESDHQKTLLIGVSYALLDFAEDFPMKLQHTIIMETGGMKGRREEISKSSMHSILKQRLGVNDIHSEYGMTELMSQAYSTGNGIFNCPPWMKIILRAEDNPLEIIKNKTDNSSYQTGAINIIDLANIDSCSFIATDDIGKLYNDGSFEVTGRLENSDIRGCGLMTI